MKRIFITEKQIKSLKENINNDTSYIFNEDLLNNIVSDKFEKKIFSKRKIDLLEFNKKLFNNELDLENPVEVKNYISKLLNQIIKKENAVKEILEKICYDSIKNLFTIPNDLVVVICNLVKEINSNNTVLQINPIENEPEYENSDEYETNQKEIEKRLILNLLINGASNVLTKHLIKTNRDEINNLDENLYDLYKKFLWLNEYYLTLEIVEINDKTHNQIGGVTVKINGENKQSLIESNALCLPVLIFETLKGFFELFISHGLPSNRKLAKYILDQTDVLKYEQYSIVMGSIIWNKIMNILYSQNVDTNLLPSILTFISEYYADDLNVFLKEVILSTKLSEKMFHEIVDTIQHNIDYEDFENRLSIKRDEKAIINDSDYMSEDELLDEKFFSMDDVINKNTPIPDGMVKSIPNELGINLSSVNGFSIEKQPDKQIKKITIDFIPEN